MLKASKGWKLKRLVLHLPPQRRRIVGIFASLEVALQRRRREGLRLSKALRRQQRRVHLHGVDDAAIEAEANAQGIAKGEGPRQLLFQQERRLLRSVALAIVHPVGALRWVRPRWVELEGDDLHLEVEALKALFGQLQRPEADEGPWAHEIQDHFDLDQRHGSRGSHLSLSQVSRLFRRPQQDPSSPNSQVAGPLALRTARPRLKRWTYNINRYINQYKSALQSTSI